MTEQVIWITGASSGIGEACARAFSKKGQYLILSSRKEEELQRVKASCANPNKIKCLVLDLAEQSNFKSTVKQGIELFGKIDILLHNAGISQRSLIKDTQLAVDRRIMEVNFFGTIALTKEILPYFILQKKGHFGVVSSLVGKFGSPYRSSYAASKHALHGFFDSLRAEHGADGITVTMLCPGFIHTNVSVNALTGDGRPLGKMDEAQAKGLSAEKCAEQIVLAIRNRKEEVLIGGKEKYGVYLKRFFPRIFSKIIQNVTVR